MTTIVVVRKGGQACIAADSLAKYGDSLESAEYIANHDKLVSVDDAWLGPTGPASAQLILGGYFDDADHSRDFSTPRGIFETLVEMQTTLKDHYHLNPKEDERDPLESMQMEILIVSPGGIFGAYPLRSIQEYTRYYAFGTGAELALGAMYVAYQGDSTPEEVALMGLQAADAFDDSTALPHTIQSVKLR